VSEQAQTIDPSLTLPIVLSLQEIQGVLFALRKLPMEQAEGLVNNIQAQANQILQQMKQAESGTGETA
jgi:hypothetical protein